MAVLRFLGNLLLAIITLCLIAAVLLTGWGVAMARTWEYEGLDYAAAEGDDGQVNWLWVDGQPIAYRTWGARPEGDANAGWVVLVHGVQAEGAETWAPLARSLLRQGASVVAVDLRGMGRSTREGSPADYTVRAQADLLARALNELQVRQATLVGFDWGCAVALQMAYDQPQFADQMVLVSPRMTRPWGPWHQYVARIPYVNRGAAWLAHGGGPLWEFVHRRALASTGDMAGAHLKQMRVPTHVVGTLDALVAMALAPEDDDLPEALAEIQTPALILVGEQNLHLPTSGAQALRQALPVAEQETLAKAGPYPHLATSAEVARYILSVR